MSSPQPQDDANTTGEAGGSAPSCGYRAPVAWAVMNDKGVVCDIVVTNPPYAQPVVKSMETPVPLYFHSTPTDRGETMATLAANIRRMENVDHVPDGTYEGVWGGYRVTFEVEGVKHEAETLDGIRTPRASCTVTSKDGRLLVSLPR
jgi:hypothetical protein